MTEIEHTKFSLTMIHIAQYIVILQFVQLQDLAGAHYLQMIKRGLRIECSLFDYFY